jgi:hypothetical protein
VRGNLGDKGGIRHVREGPISGLRFAGFSRRLWPDSGEARRSPGEVDAIELQIKKGIFLFFGVSLS